MGGNSSKLRTCTWNIAAVNNNPFEYWTTYDDPSYKKLMDEMEELIANPGEFDVPVEEVFPTELFNELVAAMRGQGWEHVDAVEQIWDDQYKSLNIISGFLKAKDIGSKRLISMPDRFTNTVNAVGENGGTPHYRPTVINNFTEETTSVAQWWPLWKRFMFEAPIVVCVKKSLKVLKPCEMLSKISRKKYPALTEEEELISIPLQTLALALFDAILIHILNLLSPDGNWLTMKRRLCDALFVNKQKRTLDILLTEDYSSCDVLFLQEVAANFVHLAEDSPLGKTHAIFAPANLDGKRDQNSVIILKKETFTEYEACREVTSEVMALIPQGTGLMDGDLIVLSILLDSSKYLLASFHGDTNGIQTIPVTNAVDQYSKLNGHAQILFGLDANVYKTPEKNCQYFAEFVEAYEKADLTSNWTGRYKEPTDICTTYNARTACQAQLQKAVKSTEFKTKGDYHPKDWILFNTSPGLLKCESSIRDNTAALSWEETPMPSLVWPSDHASVIATFDRKKEATAHSAAHMSIFDICSSSTRIN